MNFRTINQAGKETHVPPSRLRAWQKTGKLPGYFSGNRFMVNMDMLTDMLNAECMANAGEVNPQ